MKEKIIYFFIGTTAELFKIAPIIKELKKRNISYKIITSGQTNIRFNEIEGYLGLTKPDIVFKEKVSNYGLLFFAKWALHTFFTAWMIFGKEFKKDSGKEIFFVIYADPVTTTIGAIIAKVYGIKIVHIESGDLTFNLLEPFPEEICRSINIRLADILFPPSAWAQNNLKNIHKPKINTFYNTLADIFWWFMKRRPKKPISGLTKNSKYYLLIMHRQEHVFFGRKWTRNTLKYVIENSKPNLVCVLFNHPLTETIIRSLALPPSKKIVIIPPVTYIEFLELIRNSEYIATDGATNQYEAYLMGKPCIILRNYTEQIEGLDKNIVLYGSNNKNLNYFLRNYKNFRTKQVFPKFKVSKIIVDYLENDI